MLVGVRERGNELDVNAVTALDVVTGFDVTVVAVFIVAFVSNRVEGF